MTSATDPLNENLFALPEFVLTNWNMTFIRKGSRAIMSQRFGYLIYSLVPPPGEAPTSGEGLGLLLGIINIAGWIPSAVLRHWQC